VQLIAFGHPFDAQDLAPFHVEAEDETREDSAPVKQDGARPALAEFAAMLRARQVEVFPQDFERRFVRGEGDFHRFAVQGELDVGFLFRSLSHATKLAEDGGKVKVSKGLDEA
jgi:hypothetical protein